MSKIKLFFLFLLCSNFYLTQKTKDFQITDSVNAKNYATDLIFKGRKDNNNTKLADGYLLLSKFSRKDRILLYLDSAIVVSKKYPEYLSKIYTYKGNYYYLKGDYLESLDSYLSARNFCKKDSKTYNIINFTLPPYFIKAINENKKDKAI
ncbi:hypothetical protein D1632_08125 [Chryseobacterium nematophagum]|uniref:Tetratricopeptide repeat protein n=1 Tax=Chryseobacterium nematophagum TaxID=2305228 RepID=A0A3M7LA01_9FLAO|nr:hypothetical protein [Chryseobacterium nematophagum]RMZ59588.1 hypothetical protein D1632_08125 [Chryseobacterium nematophagum]